MYIYRGTPAHDERVSLLITNYTGKDSFPGFPLSALIIYLIVHRFTNKFARFCHHKINKLLFIKTENSSALPQVLAEPNVVPKAAPKYFLCTSYLNKTPFKPSATNKSRKMHRSLVLSSSVACILKLSVASYSVEG